MHTKRHFRALLIWIILLLLAQSGSLQPALGMVHPNPGEAKQAEGRLMEGLDPTRPVVARIYFSSQAELNRLAQTLDIWEVHHAEGYFLAQLTPLEWETLARGGFRLEIDAQLSGLLDNPPSALPGQVSGIPGFPCYRTVEETYAAMASLAASRPELAEVIDIGDSWEKAQPGGAAGYDLFALRLTNEARPGPKPVFFLMAEIHAREYTTAELALRFGEWLVQRYGVDPDVTWLLDYYEVHIIPMSNPDGRKLAEAGQSWRKNTDNDDGCFSPSSWGVDLNRNHSFKWGGASNWACDPTYQGPGPASEPETQAIQAYAASLFPDQRGPGDNAAAPDDTMGVFLTLHSYSRLVLYPWGWSPNPAPNQVALRTLGRKFGFFNGYEVCQSGEPGCIYATTGTSDDWAYGELGVAAYTFELGTAFFESCTHFENTILPDHLPALLYAFKAARQPYLDPAGPETLDVAVLPATVAVGEAITLTATANDSRFNSNGWGTEPIQAVAAARYSIDAPAWLSDVLTQPLEPGDGNFDSPIEGLQKSIQPGCLPPGQHMVFVESQDTSGRWGVPGAAFFQVEPGQVIGLTPLTYFGYAQPSQTITYTLTVTNYGNTVDTFGITVNSLWQVTVPASLPPLNPCESTQLIVSVTIPAEAVPGDSDIATLTLTSQAHADQSLVVSLTSFVLKSSIFLPSAYKPDR